MNDDVINLPHLRALIGLRVRHEGELCVVVEVLESPCALILEPQGAGTMIADMHGRPWEYGREHRIVPVLSDDRTCLHDALLDLEILD